MMLARRLVEVWRGGKGVIRDGLRVGRNAIRSGQGRADVERWTAPGGLEEWWDERTRLLARLVPAGVRVIEFGAGRRQLETYLPAGCTYVPSDLADRGPNTLVCDLNARPLPSLDRILPEVAVFGGVLEYVKDVRAVVAWLTESGVNTFVLSFDPVPTDLGWYRGLMERRRRLYFGYMNTLTEDALTSIFEGAGLSCVERQVWTRQLLLRFARKSR